MSAAKVTLAAGLVLIAAAVLGTLAQAPLTLALVNTPGHEEIGSLGERRTICQDGEILPQGTAAIRLRIFSELGPRVLVNVLQRGRSLTRGTQSSGWTGGAVTVPVTPLEREHDGVTLCFTLLLNGHEVATVSGSPATQLRTAHGRITLPGRVRLEYLRAGVGSWWSRALEVARRMGLGHAGSGTWSVLVAALLLCSVVALCACLALRELT